VVPVAARPPPRVSTLSLAAGGILLLAFGLAALDALNFVLAQFDRSALLGLLTLGIAGAGFGLLGWAAARELRGLYDLRAVDRARAAFARRDLPDAKAEALAFVRGLPPDQHGAIPALRDAPDVESLKRLLAAGPLEALDRKAQALGRAAAVQAFAITAISPSPGLDALVFAWRGVRLVRQVAELHGLRPGLAATAALLRRTALDAGTVAATDLVVDAATRALLSSPLLQHVAGETAAGAVAARRMLLLSRAAGQACRILPK
jgi:putative membrane protein